MQSFESLTRVNKAVKKTTASFGAQREMTRLAS